MAAPPTPGGLNVLVMFSNATLLGWNDVAGEDGYYLYKSLDNVDFSKVRVAGENITADYIMDLVKDTQHWFKISAYNEDGESALSAAVIGTTLEEAIEELYIQPGVKYEYDAAAYNIGYEQQWSLYTTGRVQIYKNLLTVGVLGVRTVVTNVAASPRDADEEEGVILCDAVGGNIVITLPTGILHRIYYVKKIDASANTVTLDPGAYTIDGAANKVLNNQYDSITVVRSTSEWHVIAIVP